MLLCPLAPVSVCPEYQADLAGTRRSKEIDIHLYLSINNRKIICKLPLLRPREDGEIQTHLKSEIKISQKSHTLVVKPSFILVRFLALLLSIPSLWSDESSPIFSPLFPVYLLILELKCGYGGKRWESLENNSNIESVICARTCAKCVTLSILFNIQITLRWLSISLWTGGNWDSQNFNQWIYIGKLQAFSPKSMLFSLWHCCVRRSLKGFY